MKKIIPYIVSLLLMTTPAMATTSIKYSQLTSGGTIATTDKFPVLRALAVSGAANNGSGLIRLTVATMTGLGIATNDLLSVSGVGGTTEANGQWAVTVVNATHLDLQASTFTHAYTTGGQVNFNPSVVVNTLATLAAAPAGTLTGATLASSVTASSLTSVGAGIALGTPASVVLTNATGTAASLNIGGNAGTVTNGVYTTDTGTVTNTMLLHPSTTVNSQVCALGGSCTISAAAALVVGSTTITSGTNGNIEYNNGGVLGELAQLGLAQGGTNSDLSATGGTSYVLRQSSSGAAVTVGQLGLGDMSDARVVYASTNNVLLGNTNTGAWTLITTATDNTALGFDTLTELISGNYNTALGISALSLLTTGSSNVAVGINAATLYEDATGTVAIGDNAVGNATTGDSNTAIGYNSGATLVTGTQNVLLGTSTDVTGSAAANQIAIGYTAVAPANNTVQIGNSSITDVYLGNSTAKIHADGSLLTAVNAATVTNGVYTTDTGTVTNTMLAGSIALTKLATQATNTVVGNATSGSAAPTALAVGTCSTAGSALNWTTNTGFGCNTSITAAAVPASGLTGATLASSVTASSLVSTGTLTGGATGAGFTIALGSSTITGTLPAANNETNLRHTSIGATFNGGGSAIAANSKQWVYVPYGTTIQSWTIGCDASGSIAFDVQMDTYANFSTSMTSIAGTDFPTVTTATKAQDLVLTGWGTTAIPAGDYILFKVTSATTVTNCNIVLDTIRT